MDQQFAKVLAGQVAVGLTPGDAALERARASLMAIGIMLLNDNPTDDQLREILEVGQQGQVTVNDDGSVSITVPVTTSEPNA